MKELDFKAISQEEVEKNVDNRCALMYCKDIIKQNLGEVIKDKTNTKEVIAQAKLLLNMGFEEADHFCQECFWK